MPTREFPRFDSFYQHAVARKGSPEALEALLPRPAGDLASVPDDRILAAMARCLFSAGFRWQIVDAMWPGFEAAFEGFHVPRVAFLGDGDLDRLRQDTRIVRHGPKIASLRNNARMMVEVLEEHDTFAQFLADWPDEDLVGLWQWLKAEGDRLGGNTGPRMLRLVGKDTFMLTGHVTKALIDSGVIDKAATGKGAQRRVQEAFNTWKQESGLSFAAMSKILACTVPD